MTKNEEQRENERAMAAFECEGTKAQKPKNNRPRENRNKQDKQTSGTESRTFLEDEFFSPGVFTGPAGNDNPRQDLARFSLLCKQTCAC